jgi:hypothetical protein
MTTLHTLGALVALVLAALEIARRLRRPPIRFRLSAAGAAQARAALSRMGAAGDRVRGA